MLHRTPGRGRRLVAAAATLGLLGLPLLTSPADAAGSRGTTARAAAPTVTVMSRNLYLGADIMRPIVALKTAEAQGASQIETLNAFANANDDTRDIVDATDFEGTRVKLLAAELVAGQPDLVGLQEVAMWRSGPLDQPGGPDFLERNAETVDYDFLALLLAELEEQGEPYKAVSVNTLSDVEGPAWDGSYGTHTQSRDVRLTMRDVILKRVDSTVGVIKGTASKGTYSVNMPPIEVAGKTVQFLRGWQSVKIKAGDKRFRFYNTHLEAFSSDVALGQAKQLIGSINSHNGTTIVVCDCNSDPLNGDVKDDIGDTKAHWAPYRFITGKGGFTDEWLEWATAEEGWTSGLSETVKDADASGFDHRIDMVFGRAANGAPLVARFGEVTGDEVADKDEVTGLWPSDHAGVLMKLKLR